MSVNNNTGIQLEDINKSAIYAQHRLEQDYIIKQEHIDRIKYLNIFSNVELNRAVTYYCKWVLNRQMKSTCLEPYLDFDNGVTEPLRYGELVALISTEKPYSNLRVCYGDYNSVTADSHFNELMKLARKNVLVTIHNHPYGGGLSWVDIKQFINSEQTLAQIVVTNHGRVFWMIKMIDFDMAKAQAEINRIEKLHPARKGVILGSKEDIQLQKIRRAVIEPNLCKLAIVYKTIG